MSALKAVVILALLTSCSSGELIEEYEEISYPASEEGVNPHYPWERSFVGDHSRITKEFFRCKGCGLNPIRVEGEQHLADCDGPHHGLPLVDGEEAISPLLIDLLNGIQERMGKRVVVTCGHRCPQHNTYADPSPFNATSKHMVGAEVDFYVQGMEEDPEAVVTLLLELAGGSFQRYHKDNTNVSTPPWYSGELFIKLYLPNEGRDYDNRHPYPYIGVQLRRVPYSWPAAHRGYAKR